MRVSLLLAFVMLAGCSVTAPADLALVRIVQVDRTQLHTYSDMKANQSAEPIALAVVLSSATRLWTKQEGVKVVGNTIYLTNNQSPAGVYVYTWVCNRMWSKSFSSGDSRPYRAPPAFGDTGASKYSYVVMWNIREPHYELADPKERFDLARKPEDICIDLRGALRFDPSRSNVVRVPAQAVADALARPPIPIPDMVEVGF